VAGVLAALADHFRGAFEAEVVEVNGAPGLLVESDGIVSVVALTVDEGRIRAIDVIRNPDKLHHLAPMSVAPAIAANRVGGGGS
jgi:RNA polymerase sigma-70 factor, ECF subfamily